MKKIIIANFKANKTVNEASEWLQLVTTKINENTTENYEFCVAPSLISLQDFSNKIKSDSIKLQLAVQTLSAFPSGSYTGAVSAQNLQSLNVSYAIVGHSERRKYFAENSKDVANQVSLALENSIIPIVCVDEGYLEEQLAAIDANLLSKCVFAYEPLSAIGSGNNASISQVEQVKNKIKTICGEVRFIYGGSVTDQNVAEYLIVTDGVLVGSFALDANNFLSLISTATAD